MKNQLLERYINQVLLESKQDTSIAKIFNALKQDAPDLTKLENYIYSYLRSANQSIIKYNESNHKEKSDIVDAIKKAKPNIVDDLKVYCSGYKVVDELRKITKTAQVPVKKIDFSPPWLFVNLEESVASNRSITYSDPKQKKNIVGSARHNLYFTIKDTNITDKASLINNIESYWKKRYAVMANLIPLLSLFNDQYSTEGIFVTQFKTSWPITSKGLFSKDFMLEDKLFEADTLKIYIGGVDRNTSNLSSIKEELYNKVIARIQRCGLQVVKRKRAKFGKDYNQSSFGGSVSKYIAKNLVNLKKAKNQELINILNSNLDPDVFSKYLDKNIKIIEDYVNDPKNSAKIR